MGYASVIRHTLHIVESPQNQVTTSQTVNLEKRTVDLNGILVLIE